ncbi:MAG: hypothetical protein P8X79_02490 [Reinekea sp.]
MTTDSFFRGRRKPFPGVSAVCGPSQHPCCECPRKNESVSNAQPVVHYATWILPVSTLESRIQVIEKR